MQDRFKFRYNFNNKIYNVSAIDFSHSRGEIVSLDEREAVIGKLDLDNLIQYSGLKDKNGKLIYEGDILDLYVSTKKLYRYQVKFEIGSFMLVSKDEIFDFRNIWNDNVYPLSQLYFEYQNEENSIWECEIIGNIYENPELLDESFG